MAVAGSLQFSSLLGVCRDREPGKQFKYVAGTGNQHLRAAAFSSCASRQDLWSCNVSMSINKPMCSLPHRCNVLRCHSFMYFGQNITVPALKNTTAALTRSCNALQSSPLFTKLVPAIGIIIFALWGLRPLMRMSRNLLLHKSDNSWRKSTTNYIMTSYLQPILLWTGAILICRAFDPIVMPTEASRLVKQRLLTFVKSLSTVLAFAYCLSSAIQQVQRFLMETNDPTDTRNLGFQFAGKAVYSAVWVAAVSLFMELLGFSTQKWLTAGGLGTVLLTLAGREIFTNFLSSAMIHATRPFVVNDWIQTKIEGYEVSGFVEHVGWWSPTIIRGEDREAVHIPNHKFTVNVVRNLTQKTHWRIKTHLAISHLDVGKINNIVADMRKVLAKNPQIEQQRLHRRVFLENVDPENQALMILISCFVKTSHFEEYLCVKEAVLLDLLRVIRHHRARLATPIRTIQKVYGDIDLDSLSFSDTIFSRRGPASSRPLLLVEPAPKINGEDNKSSSKSQASKPGPTGNPSPKADSTKPASSKSETTAGDSTPSDLRPSGNVPKTTPESNEADGKPLNGGPASSSSQAKQDEKSSSSGPSSSSAQAKQAEKLSGSEPGKPGPSALEENIVLGVALEGSKRTLPIEDGLDPHEPQTLAEGKEQVAARGNSSSDNDDKDK